MTKHTETEKPDVSFEERGIFWWQDEAIPEGCIAPQTAVSGNLLIDVEGRITLDLDGYLTGEDNALDVMFKNARGEIKGRSLIGILRTSNQRVFLTNVYKNGSHASTNGLTYQGLQALNCLIGREIIADDADAKMFSELRISLKGMDEWFRVGSIENQWTDSSLIANYKQPDPIRFTVDNGTLSIEYHWQSPTLWKRRTASLSIEEAAVASLVPSEHLTLKEIGLEHQIFSDLMLLLTESNYQLDWPTIVHHEKGGFRWYFLRMKSHEPASPPSATETGTNFPILRNAFGTIYSTWRKKREELGPAVYLYLGTKRGVPLFVEHRFVNLVLGIETFHRIKHPASPTQEHLDRMCRILTAIPDSKDKRFVKGRLKYSYEPTLESRLVEILTRLSLSFDEKNIKAFAKKCADRRNDTAHFGGPRSNAETYDAYLRDLGKLSDALSTLYHAMLLIEIGIDEKIVSHWIFDGLRSYFIKRELVAAGLLDESALASPVSKLPAAVSSETPAASEVSIATDSQATPADAAVGIDNAQRPAGEILSASEAPPQTDAAPAPVDQEKKGGGEVVRVEGIEPPLP